MILVGMLTGILSSFFGIGGGSLIVPFLVSLFPGMDFQDVVATSLGAIFVNASMIVIKSLKLKEKVSLKTFLSIGIPSLIGAFAGSFFLPFLGYIWPKRLFVLVLFLTILKTIIPSRLKRVQDQEETTVTKFILIGLIGGVVSSLTGLGGGIIMVPMMMFFTEIKLKRHSLISQSGMILATLAGVLAHSFVTHSSHEFLPWSVYGRINWGIVFLLQVGSFCTTGWGLKQNEKVSPKVKKILLVILFTILGGKIFISTL